MIFKKLKLPNCFLFNFMIIKIIVLFSASVKVPKSTADQGCDATEVNQGTNAGTKKKKEN